MADEYLPLERAAEYLGVSKTKMWQLVRAGELDAYQDPRDKRKKLLKQADLDRWRQPQKVSRSG